MQQKFTFAHIAAIGASSQSKSPQMGESCIQQEVQDRQGVNEQNSSGRNGKQSEDRQPMSKAPTMVRKESPWKLTEAAVPVDNKESAMNSPTPAESSKKNDTVKKNSGPPQKIGCWKKLDIDVNFRAPNRSEDLEKSAIREESKVKESSQTLPMAKKAKSTSQPKNGKDFVNLNAQPVENKGKSRKSPGESYKSNRNEIDKASRRQNSQKSNQISSTKGHNQRKSSKRSTGNQVKNTTGRNTKSKKQQKRKGNNNNRKSRHSRSPSSKEFASLKPSAVAQVEYFFSVNELVKNVFLRKQMDVEGFIPAMVVFNFPSVLSFGIPYHDLLNSISSRSKIIEVDMENDCLRLKGGEENYKKWLFPNQDGSFGCPKWIKQKQPLDDNQTEITDEKDLKEDVMVIVEMGESGESLLHGKEKQHDKSRLPDLAMTDSDTDQTSTDSDSQ